MKDYKPMSTHMVTICKLRKNDESKEVDQRLCRSMFGTLLYVTTSRLYAMKVVGQIARFQVEPKETHVLVVKRIFIYIKGTTNFGLWYPKGNELTMVSYIDLD
jgi:hypothetical protein